MVRDIQLVLFARSGAANRVCVCVCVPLLIYTRIYCAFVGFKGMVRIGGPLALLLGKNMGLRDVAFAGSGLVSSSAQHRLAAAKNRGALVCVTLPDGSRSYPCSCAYKPLYT